MTKKQDSLEAKYPEHICRFNDPPQVCECYDEGFKAQQRELIEKFLKKLKYSEYEKEDGGRVAFYMLDPMDYENYQAEIS